MYQELTSVYEQQCTDLILHDQSSFESEDSGQMQILYPFDSNYPETITEDNINTSFDLYVHQEEFNPHENSPQMSSLGSSQEEPHLLQERLPAVVDSSEMHWITSSSTDLRSQSPVTTSSPRPQASIVSPFQCSSLTQSLHDRTSTKSPAVSTIVHNFSNQSDPSKTKTLSASTQPLKAKSSAPTKPKGTPGRKRKFQDYELSPAEAARRHIRRERNKLAAAKCRNRRRELTDRLQGETDHLEDHQQMLQQEIITLEREKKSLECILATHRPNCKAGIVNDNSFYHQQGAIDLSNTSAYQEMDNGILTESDDRALTYMKKHGNISTPLLSALPVSIAISPHNFRQEETHFNSRDLHSNNRRIQVVDYANTPSPTTCRNLTFEPTQHSFRASKMPQKMNSFPSHTSTGLEMSAIKSSLSFQGLSMSSDDYGGQNVVNNSPSFTSSVSTISSNPFHEMGRSSQQFCSFDHRQHSTVDARQRSDSVTSPKHLLAL